MYTNAERSIVRDMCVAFGKWENLYQHTKTSTYIHGTHDTHENRITYGTCKYLGFPLLRLRFVFLFIHRTLRSVSVCKQTKIRIHSMHDFIWCIILDVDFDVVSVVLAPSVSHLTSTSMFDALSQLQFCVPVSNLWLITKHTHTHTGHSTRDYFFLPFHQQLLLAGFFFFSHTTAHRPTHSSAVRLMVVHSTGSSLVCARREHFSGSSFPLVVNICILPKPKIHILFVYVFASAPLSHFRLSAENTILCLRSSFHLKLHFFFSGRLLLLLLYLMRPRRHRGNATNQRTIFTMSSWVRWSVLAPYNNKRK